MFLFRKKKFGGWIKVFKLEDWWESIPQVERDNLGEYLKSVDAQNLDEGEINRFEQENRTPQKVLHNISFNASRHAKYRGVAKIIALKALDVPGDPITRHFVYNTLIDLSYKERKTNPSALEECLQYCIGDIQNMPAFRQSTLEEERVRKKNPKLKMEDAFFPPNIPSFNRSIDIYEKRGDTESAINICKQIIGVGFKNYGDKLKELEEKRDKSKK